MLILRTTRTAQPAQPSGVEWANPLTRGLIVAISGSKPVELVNGVALRSEGGPAIAGAPPGMSGPRFDGSSGVLWAPIPRIALGNWTLLQVVRGNSPATDRRSFNVGNSTTNTVIVAIGTGASNAAKVRAVGVNDAGTAPGDTGQVSAADAFVNTGSRVVGLRYDRESGYQCFVNGVADGFAAYVDAASTYTVDRVGVGALYRTGAAAFFAGDSFGAFAWSRALSNEEIAEASRNPWQLFAPEPRRIWVPGTAPSGLTVNAGIGAATAAGLQATISLGRTVAAGIGAGTAAGLQAGISLSRTVAAGIGAATATGLQAGISLGRTVGAGIGAATAAGLGATIETGAGTIIAGVGAAAATGLTAGISLGRTIGTGVGAAEARGLQASISNQIIVSSAAFGDLSFWHTPRRKAEVREKAAEVVAAVREELPGPIPRPVKVAQARLNRLLAEAPPILAGAQAAKIRTQLDTLSAAADEARRARAARRKAQQIRLLLED